MATVRISDTVVPEVFANYMFKDTVQTMAFFQTGVFRQDAELAARLSGGGRTFNVPFWKDLDDTESDPASDDPDSHATPGALTSGTDVARRHIRTRGWSSARLAAELAGSDPMQRIRSRVNAYWMRQFDDVMIATLRGVFADNIANDSGDMVNDDGTDAVGAPSATELFNAEGLMDTAQTLGDAKRDLKLLVMHSVVHTRLAKNNLIDFRPDTDQANSWHEYFGDYRIHVSDRVTKVTGANRVKYWTYLLGENAFGWAESPVDVPVEVDPVPSAGNGMGVENLWTRRQFAMHPYGIKWTDNTVAEEFPSNAEIALAANWDRVYTERKMLPMALYITNG